LTTYNIASHNRKTIPIGLKTMYFNSHLAHFGLATLCLSNIAVQAALVKAAPHVVVAESTSLEPRLAATAVDYLGVFKEILKAIGVFTEDQHSKAWVNACIQSPNLNNL